MAEKREKERRAAKKKTKCDNNCEKKKPKSFLRNFPPEESSGQKVNNAVESPIMQASIDGGGLAKVKQRWFGIVCP